MAGPTSSNAWNDGYVVDVAYTEPIIGYLCPSHISMSAVLHGQPPLSLDRPLTWLDLGSGSGVSACMVAAANRDVEVWGCDFNPAHVERARAFAADAGLSDVCTFEEASFAEVAANDDLGPASADVIVVHGVYSWISRANQEHIGEIVKPAPAPGRRGVRQLRRAHRLVGDDPRGRGPAPPRPGRRAAERPRVHHRHRRPLPPRRCRRPAFPLSPYEAPAFENLRTSDPRYAAHEFLGAHFRPVMFQEVEEVMAAGRCSYLGSLEATDLLTRLGPQGLVDLVGEVTDVTVRETMRDLAVQRPLRRDLFRRGLATSTVVDQEGWLRDLTVIGLDQPLVEGVVGGGASGDRLARPRLLPSRSSTLLAERPITVADLLSIHPGLSFSDAIGSIALLIGGGYACPEIPGWRAGPTVERTRRLNEVLIDENRRGGDHGSLISPATGGALGSEYVEMLTVGAVWSGMERDPEQLTDHAARGAAPPAPPRPRGRRAGGRRGRLPVTSCTGRVSTALDRIDGLFTAHGVC